MIATWWFSVWIRVAGAGDTDLMVGESRMGAGKFYFWHVASGAVGLCDPACFGVQRGRVTSGAFRIVAGQAGLHGGVRIVARSAADAPIGCVVALAIGEPIRLETH